MKIAVTVGALVLVLSQTSMAAETKMNLNLPISKQMESIKKQDESTVKNATRMMAHLSFAAQAIDLKMKKSALENLGQAKKLCITLEKSKFELISEYKFKYGKATYAIDGVERDYYVPVADDVFVEGRFDEKEISQKNLKVEEKGLAIVHSSLRVNLANVDSSIESAESLTKDGKFEDARKALEGVFKNALSEEEVVTNPVWTVWSDLMLAQEFMTAGRFQSVRFALNSAQTDLQKLERDGVLTKSGDEAKNLRAEIEKIQKTLDDKDPTTVQKMQAKLNGWAHKVKSWF